MLGVPPSVAVPGLPAGHRPAHRLGCAVMPTHEQVLAAINANEMGNKMRTPQEALEAIKQLHGPIEQSVYEKQRSGHQSMICGGCRSLYTKWPCETRKIADNVTTHVYSNWKGW